MLTRTSPPTHAPIPQDLPVWLAGVSSLEGAERRAGKELWEWWLDALSFRPDSAGRLHIRQTLKHPDVQRKIQALFEALDVESRGHLDADAVVRFSEGIQGTVRVLLDQREPRCVITIPPATAAEHDFLVMNFPILFPPEHPLDLRAFQSLAKLVLVRRIVKALVTHHGLYRVQRGMRAPIVVDLTVREMSWCDETGKNKPGGVELLRVHTVAPSTAAAVEGFRLGSIEESPSNSSSPRAADQHWKKRGKTLFGGGGTPSAG